MAQLKRAGIMLDEVTEKKIRDLLEEKPQRNPYKRFTILSYQIADVGRCLRYMDIYPDRKESYELYLKSALADTLIQTIMLAKLYQMDLDELLKMGAERLDEFKKKERYVEAE